MHRSLLHPRTAGLVVTVLVLVVAVLATGVASAARLSLTTPGQPYGTAVQRCATGPAAVAASGTPVGGQYTQVTVSGLGGTCTTGRVILATSAGTVLLDATGTLAAGTFTATTTTPFSAPTATTARVFVAGDGWPVSATWTPPAASGPVYPGPDGSAFDTTVTWDLTNATSGQQACFTIRVTTRSTTPIVWSAWIDTTQAPFNGARTGYSLQGDESWKYQLGAPTTAGLIKISGRTDVWQPYDTVVVGQVRTVTVCNFSLPGAVVTPSAYTVSFAQGTWTDREACVVTTVTGNGTSPFYVAWQTPVDMTAAVARLRSAGGSPDAWRYGGEEWRIDRTVVPSLAGPYVFQTTSRTASNIVGTQSFAFSTCVVDR
ncbi:hypothetical protein [Cellulomonas fimi]|uniref:hypothetical protein n=1 Tax=Cellulomonas fimi TaxID=1708 RepID=UPI002358823B|nr:hypothetical protein [Cellulomonas fimi]